MPPLWNYNKHTTIHKNRQKKFIMNLHMTSKLFIYMDNNQNVWLLDSFKRKPLTQVDKIGTHFVTITLTVTHYRSPFPPPPSPATSLHHIHPHASLPIWTPWKKTWPVVNQDKRWTIKLYIIAQNQVAKTDELEDKANILDCQQMQKSNTHRLNRPFPPNAILPWQTGAPSQR